MIVLPLCYLPPVSWFAVAARYPEVYVETGQHYRKQTYASRAFIRTAHGPLQLTVPVERRDGLHIPLAEKKMVFATDWQHHHWKSLQTAYHKSPYFEHYDYRLEPLLRAGEPLLAAHLLHLTQALGGWLGLRTRFIPTQTWAESPTEDWRTAFGNSPEEIPNGVDLQPYMQVFDEFMPNLSAVDLLFCCGPTGIKHLQ